MKKLSIFLCILLMFLTVPYSSFAESSNVNVKVNGELITFDVSPYIEDGRTLVPVRFVAEALGGEVNWENDTRTVIITYVSEEGPKEFRLPIDSTTVTINYGGASEEFALDVPAKIKDSRTMIPLRFISEALGCEVNWDQETRTVSIVDPSVPTEDELVQDETKIVDEESQQVIDMYPELYNALTNEEMTYNEGEISASVTMKVLMNEMPFISIDMIIDGLVDMEDVDIKTVASATMFGSSQPEETQYIKIIGTSSYMSEDGETWTKYDTLDESMTSVSDVNSMLDTSEYFNSDLTTDFRYFKNLVKTVEEDSKGNEVTTYYLDLLDEGTIDLLAMDSLNESMNMEDIKEGYMKFILDDKNYMVGMIISIKGEGIEENVPYSFEVYVDVSVNPIEVEITPPSDFNLFNEAN